MTERHDRGFARFALIFVLLVLAGGGVLAYDIDRRLSAPGPDIQDQVIWIERGDGLRNVAAKLENLGFLSGQETDLFYYYGRSRGLPEALRAGEFTVPPEASIKALTAHLADADPLLRFVTIPEGRTSAQTMRILNKAPVLEGRIESAPDEGALLPETYAYERGEERQKVLMRMEKAHDDLLAALWPERADDLPFQTPQEAVILASIVEKETAVAAERPRVASVFVNRLKRGMRLQSDPTIIYGITGGEPLGRGIRQSELQDTDNPYNTYRISGLPPTAIANPGKESLAAVLNPANTDDLYFVADGSGGHVFARTLREHNRNVAAWRRIERQGPRASP